MHSESDIPGVVSSHSSNDGHSGITQQSLVPPVQTVRLRTRQDTCYSTDWTAEEQVALDATLDKYPVSRHTPLERYLRAAAVLPKKTARDVALRVRWLATTSNAAKRRLNEENAAKKRPRVQSIFAVQPKGAPPLGLPGTLPLGSLSGAPYPPLQTNLTGLDDHTSSALGVVAGPMGNLLEQNYLILNQYKQNMQQYKVHENTDLLVRFRDNIVTILSQMNCMSGLMQRMPPLPVSLNYDLARDFLPPNGSSSNFAPVHGAVPGSGAYKVMPEPIDTTMKISPTMPVTNVPQSQPKLQAVPKPEPKAAPPQSKPKPAPKKANSVKSEEKPVKLKAENGKSSSRRSTPPKALPTRTSETRSSARLAAASDSANS